VANEGSAYKISSQLPPPRRRLRFGIVGGGGGGFIGPVHMLAARMDNRYELLAAAPSSRPDVAIEAGREWLLPPERVYSDYRQMAAAEAARSDGVEVVAVATPNHLHYDAACAFLDAGIHVICDKPLTTTLEQAADLVQRVRQTGLSLFVTHAFAAYPMVRQARAMVGEGRLGNIRLVHVEFMQDWLTRPIDVTGDKHAAWRTDPAKSGSGGAIADIGTHAYHLARFAARQEVASLSATLFTVVPGRRLDDNAHLRMTFDNGAQGTMILSQTAPGNECGLRIRIYGDAAGLEWRQEGPNYLRFASLGQPVRIFARGEAELGADAQRMSRVPRGHPEGYLEAFTNLYSEVAVALEARLQGLAPPAPMECASVEDGAIGVGFIEAAIKSSQAGGAWIDPRVFGVS
jgi:predicted dehydrogenase